jgi:cytidylate kinase
MQIVCISRGSLEYGSEVAEKISEKTGYATLSREMITDKATEFGIPVGKLEMTILRNRPLSEEMSLMVDMYKSFATAFLCERAEKENIIYHGRTGHLVLPGLSHVLRVRAIADAEFRIKQVGERLRVDRVKAKSFILQVDEDIRKWTRTLYNTDWNDPAGYDITINAAHLSAENAASALLHFIQLSQFQAAPASDKKLHDLLLAARCRLAIGSDERTRDLDAKIHAEGGHVSVTTMPRQAGEAELVPEVLRSVEGITSLVCTVATTNILLVGEKFDPGEESFGTLLEISNKWNAAIELVRMAAADESPGEGSPDAKRPRIFNSRAETGGILEDSDAGSEHAASTEHGVYETIDSLIKAGHAGGSLTVYGGTDELMKALPRTEHYSLVAVGNVFHSRGAAQPRLKRDMINKLKDEFRVPVIGTEDLKARYMFGPRQFLSLVVFAALAALLYYLVFTFQEPVLLFASKGHFGGSLAEKLAAACGVAVCIPFVAFIIGGFFSNLLKLLKME